VTFGDVIDDLGLTSGNVVGGVISGFIVIAIVEAWWWCRRRLDWRPLARILGKSKRVGIVSPSFPTTRGRDGMGHLTEDNAYAIAYVIEACERVDASVEVTPFERMPPGFPADVVAIGGYRANGVTAYWLREKCPGFVIEKPPAGSGGPPRFRCGAHTFQDTEDDAWAFCVKIAREDAAGRNVVLLWGEFSIGTTAAAYTFQKRTELIDDRHGSSFFIALRVPKQQGFTTQPVERVDVTLAAFAASDIAPATGGGALSPAPA
jgi:hypothetical protein